MNKRQQQRSTYAANGSYANGSLFEGDDSLDFSGQNGQGNAHDFISQSRPMGTLRSVDSFQLVEKGGTPPDKLEVDLADGGFETMRGPLVSTTQSALRKNDSIAGGINRSALKGFGVPLRGAPLPPAFLPSRLADRLKEQVRRSGKQENKLEQARRSMDRSKPAKTRLPEIGTKVASVSLSRVHVIHEHGANFKPVTAPTSKSSEINRHTGGTSKKPAEPPRSMMDDLSDFVGFQL